MCGEEAIVSFEGQPDGVSHGKVQHRKAEAAGKRCGDGGIEKHPDVCAVARPRAFDSGIDAVLAAGMGEGERLLLPSSLVEIAYQHVRARLLVCDIHANHVAEWMGAVREVCQERGFV